MTEPAQAPTPTAPAPAPAPLLVDAKEAAALLGIGRTLFLELNVSGRCPRPLRFGRAVRWSVDELTKWARAGAPPRLRWEAMQGNRP